MKANRKAIEAFLSSKKIAIAGVSRDSKKFGHTVFKELSLKGFDVYPINPTRQFTWRNTLFPEHFGVYHPM